MRPNIEAFQEIRGYALLMVFVSHCSNLLIVNDTNALTYFGAAGVSLFLCLSGFLTAYHYLARETLPGAIQIYKGKWRKFYKLHFLTLILALPLSLGLFRKSIWKWAVSLTFNASLVHIIPPPHRYIFPLTRCHGTFL